MPLYPAATFGRFVLQRRDVGPRRFRRKIRCPNPACPSARRKGPQRIGRQTVVERIDPTAGFVVVGYESERIDVAGELISRPDLSGGLPCFGLPEPAWRQRASGGSPSRVAPHRANPVLPSVGDSQMVGRHDPRRARGSDGYWHLGLSGPAASRPFVMTCPVCRQRCLVPVALPFGELRSLSEAARKGPDLVI